MVGEVMLQVLAERNLPIDELILVASERSEGKVIRFRESDYKTTTLPKAVAMKPDFALFSAGGDISTEWAPKFAEVGCKVIDNSSAWRMTEGVPLVVPEINADHIKETDRIIANPNCSTIQLVMALAPLHNAYKLKRVVVSTYQSVSGTGKAAVDQMEGEMRGEQMQMVYPYKIHGNALPHCDIFDDEGYTREERKLEREPLKILSDDSFFITATAVRIPTSGGHSESVNVEFHSDFELSDVRKLLHETPGVVLQDNPATNTYPMPLTAHGKDEVFVGRVRRDFSQPRTLQMWIVADNLRKGAATNAVQILEYLTQR
jgi:aspartate-semialdehyde dehydrogenase